MFALCCFLITKITHTQTQSSQIFVKVLYVVFLFTFFKSYVCNAMAKFLNKENNAVVEITGM